MRPRSFCLTEAETAQLQTAYLHCQEADAKIRYQAVRLYGTGYAVTQIKDICGCSRTSLMEWTQAYRQHGLPALLDHRNGGNRARLKPEQIEAVQTKSKPCKPNCIATRQRHFWDETPASATDSSGQWLIWPTCLSEIMASSTKAIPLT